MLRESEVGNACHSVGIPLLCNITFDWAQKSSR